MSRILFKDISQEGCIIKSGSLKNGYARAWYKGKTLLAHRVAYMKSCGDIPAGIELHHLCGQRQCINTEHLKPVTRQEHNAIHGVGGIAKKHKEATHCKRGHELDGRNKKQRFCLTCKHISQRNYLTRKALTA